MFSFLAHEKGKAPTYRHTHSHLSRNLVDIMSKRHLPTNVEELFSWAAQTDKRLKYIENATRIKIFGAKDMADAVEASKKPGGWSTLKLRVAELVDNEVRKAFAEDGSAEAKTWLQTAGVKLSQDIKRALAPDNLVSVRISGSGKFRGGSVPILVVQAKWKGKTFGVIDALDDAMAYLHHSQATWPFPNGVRARDSRDTKLWIQQERVNEKNEKATGGGARDQGGQDGGRGKGRKAGNGGNRGGGGENRGSSGSARGSGSRGSAGGGGIGGGADGGRGDGGDRKRIVRSE